MPRKSPYTAVAALAVSLPDGAALRTFRLLPAGRFRATDGSGRPVEVPEGWLLDAADAARLQAVSVGRASKSVIDYEHQTLLAADNGKPAPAAGFFQKLEARGDGLYAVDVEWTAQAAAMIQSGEYRYISPVFAYDKRTGQVLAIAHAALTNNPGLDGLTDLARLSAHLFPDQVNDKESPMKELLAALGLAETATETQALSALTALKSTHDTALVALKAAAPDPAQYVAVATLSAVQGELSAANAALATLKAEKHVAEVAQVVVEALAAGKITPATEAWARDLGKTNLAALTAYIAAAPVVAKPGGTQTGGNGPAGTGTAALTADQVKICTQMNITPEDFQKTLAAESAGQ